MKIVLLAGGFGTRLTEETVLRPKPMVEVGGIPILLHIMGIYAAHGCQDFIIACGYRGQFIKEYFANFHVSYSNSLVKLCTGERTTLDCPIPDWNVWSIDTGYHTMTGGRLRRLRQYVGDETFMVTYGDGVGDVDVTELLAFHRRHGRVATLTAVQPPSRFGCLRLSDTQVLDFSEKPQGSAGWINGGFFVFEPAIFDYLDGDATVLEKEPLELLVEAGQLMAYEHPGFWQPMDTVRDRQLLEKLWAEGKAPWELWRNGHGGLRGLFGQASVDHRPDGFQGVVARNVA